MRILLLILLTGTLQAQTGEAALSSSETSSSNWQNWTFAAISAVTATAGILVVTMDNGTTAH